MQDRGAHRLLGDEAAPFNASGQSPGSVLPYLRTTRFVRGQTRLDPAIRSLVGQLVATIHGCSWCLDVGRSTAERAGLDAA